MTINKSNKSTNKYAYAFYTDDDYTGTFNTIDEAINAAMISEYRDGSSRVWIGEEINPPEILNPEIIGEKVLRFLFADDDNYQRVNGSFLFDHTREDAIKLGETIAEYIKKEIKFTNPAIINIRRYKLPVKKST
jgi:hypothetical protein